MDTIIKYETALLAKSKGFKPPISAVEDWFDPNTKGGVVVGKRAGWSPTMYYVEEGHIPMTTQTFLQKWLRDVQEILVFAMPVSNKPPYYWWAVSDLWADGSSIDSSENPIDTSYEEALEEALYAALSEMSYIN